MSGTIYLRVTPSTNEVSSAAGTASYSVSSNVNWRFRTMLGGLAASKPNPTTISVNYDANPTTATRTATITASGPEGVSASATLKQGVQSGNINEIGGWPGSYDLPKSGQG